MTPSPITYADVMVKHRVEAWAEGLEFDPEEQIFMLFEDKFGAREVTVLDAPPKATA